MGFFPQNFGNLLNAALENLNKYWENCTENNPCLSHSRSDVPTDLQVGLSPNPVLDNVALTVELEADSELRIRFVGNTGLQMETLVSGVEGSNTFNFSTKNLAAGVYTVMVQTGKSLRTLRMVKVRN